MLRLAVVSLAVAAVPAFAGLPHAVFDFEEAPVQQGPGPLSFWRGDQSLTLAGDDTLPMSVFEPGAGYPADWGTRAFRTTLRPSATLVMSFSPGVTGVFFDYGAWEDTQAVIRVEVIGFGGQVIDESVLSLVNRVDLGADPERFLYSYLAPTTALEGLRLTGLGDGSAFFAMDNVTLIVPAPGTMALLGAMGLAAARRRRSA